MAQKDFEFKPVKPGDPIAAQAWNDIGAMVQRLSGVPGTNSISTGAGVFTRNIPSASSTVVHYFRLNEPLYRTTTADADQLEWSDASEDFVDTGDDVTLYGDFSTGYWFAEDMVQAVQSADADRWYVLGCGHTIARGVLDKTINTSGEKVTVSVYRWSSPSWSDSGDDLRVREALGIASPLVSTTAVVMEWHEQAQMWVLTGAACA